VNLRFYLFKENVQRFEEAIQEKYLSGEGSYYELRPISRLDFECRAYIQSNKCKKPPWVDYLQRYFEVDNLELLNTSNSFVLLIKVHKRIFAVTFGYAFNILEHSKLEPRFGLKTALNSLDAEQIRTIDARNIDVATRQRRTHINVASPVENFDLNINLDWIWFISGKPKDVRLGTSIAGADSLVINNKDIQLHQLGSKCEELLNIFQSDSYKKTFSFIDSLQPIPKHEAIVQKLDSLLFQRLENRSYERIAVAYPEIPDVERLDALKIYRGRTKKIIPEAELSAVYEFLDEYSIESDPTKIFLVGLDADGGIVLRRRSLKDYLVCEVDYQNATYVLSMGQWFQINRDYLRQVQVQVDSINDVTDFLKLPAIRRGEREDDYNKRVAESKGWLLLDKKTFQFPNSWDKIEVCDILSDNRYFICVKKMGSSSTLSHLFAQGSVSARLLREHPPYRAKLIQIACTKWPGWDVNAGTTFVFAIPSEKTGRLCEHLFLFSKINLIEHRRIIERLGYRVALCKIDYERSNKAGR
jgi:uncharacterized protein (TIGR04141 family)